MYLEGLVNLLHYSSIVAFIVICAISMHGDWPKRKTAIVVALVALPLLVVPAFVRPFDPEPVVTTMLLIVSLGLATIAIFMYWKRGRQ